ncbi:hypothetical protein RO3G_13993 [Rhizopus delemar RA 99-880]|uniref:Uncharacterized protein n=1 Tax=Rhizopus delemar (strain RA 99-880 / ATCC MYA-4621 / FGSC 9543 / NRRL 43880) TaxID=246409 RepID=I1CLF2_RHIO9|nr:hypothetical protein RO3G_13993 [Rhizopus delemar RA 99-880]|eukprot:EIE89282.1 hypothetical protein RO3G_13993 [Rhizopus delemar RA 99-880]
MNRYFLEFRRGCLRCPDTESTKSVSATVVTLDVILYQRLKTQSTLSAPTVHTILIPWMLTWPLSDPS